MPRYFFNVYHQATHVDRDGEELPDKEEAWAEATRIAGGMIRDIDGKLRPGQDWRMEVTDEFANPLWEIRVVAQKK
jgi:nitrate reductase beta subunit